MTYQKVTQKAAVDKGTCIGIIAFAVNLISSKKQANKHNFEISQVDIVQYP